MKEGRERGTDGEREEEDAEKAKLIFLPFQKHSSDHLTRKGTFEVGKGMYRACMVGQSWGVEDTGTIGSCITITLKLCDNTIFCSNHT